MKIPIYKCPNCNKKMKDESYAKMEEFYHWEDEVFYYQNVRLLFINNHLNMQIEPLTKYQCWCDIKKYFDEAKKTPLHDDQYYLDLQESYGMDESYFF